MTPFRALLAMAAAGVCGGACTDRADAPHASYAVDTLPSGLLHVRNTGTGQWTSGTAWTLEEDLRLGTADVEGPELFGQVAYILSDAEGRIFVLDYQAQEIRVFLASGEFSHRIGSKGEGPGELTGAAGLDWGPDGSLWVWGSQRYTAFAPDGSLRATHPRLVRGVIYPWIGGFVPDGRYIDWGLDREVAGRRSLGQFEVQTYTGRTMFYPIAVGFSGTLDTLALLDFQTAVTPDGDIMTPPKSLMVAQAEDGHLWFAESDSYRIAQTTLPGDTLLLFSLPDSPAPVPEAEIDSLIRLTRDTPRPMDRSMFLPHRRLVTRVLTDDAGHIFVWPEEAGVAEGSVVDVFDDSGVHLGRIDVPEPVLTRAPPPYVTSTHLYAVVVDELAVPHVVRYRIRKP